MVAFDTPPLRKLSARHPELGHIVATESRGFWREARFSPNAAQDLCRVRNGKMSGAPRFC
jgi:hypothetical protein